MNISEIEIMWDEDCKIDPDNLHLESIKIPSLYIQSIIKYIITFHY